MSDETVAQIWSRGFDPARFTASAESLENHLLARRAVERLLFPFADAAMFEMFIGRLNLDDSQRAIADMLFERYQTEVEKTIDTILAARPLAGGDRTSLDDGLNELDRHIAHLVDGVLTVRFGEVEVEDDERIRKPDRFWIRRRSILPHLKPFPGYSAWHVAGDDLDPVAALEAFRAALDPETRDALSRQLEQWRDEAAADLDMLLERFVRFHRLAIMDNVGAMAAGDEEAMRRAWRRDRARWVEQDALIQRYLVGMRQLLTDAGRPDLNDVWTRIIVEMRFPILYQRGPEAAEVRDWLAEHLPRYADEKEIQRHIDTYQQALEAMRSSARRVVRTARRTMHPTLDGREPPPAQAGDGESGAIEPVPDATPHVYGRLLDEAHLRLRMNLHQAVAASVNDHDPMALEAFRTFLLRE